MLSLYELRKIHANVTAVLFKKEEYMFEGILRWLTDRGFGCENFEETDMYYVFKQPVEGDFRSFTYHKLEGAIAVEVGSYDRGEVETAGNYPDINKL